MVYTVNHVKYVCLGLYYQYSCLCTTWQTYEKSRKWEEWWSADFQTSSSFPGHDNQIFNQLCLFYI